MHKTEYKRPPQSPSPPPPYFGPHKLERCYCGFDDRKRQKDKPHWFIDLMIIIAVMGILAAVFIPMFFGQAPG